MRKVTHPVRELREIVGMTQAQFAAMVGVSKDTIISVELGRNELSDGLMRKLRIATGAMFPLVNGKRMLVSDTELADDAKTITREWRKAVRKGKEYTPKIKRVRFYTKEDFDLWRFAFGTDSPENAEQAARKQYTQIADWIKLILLAAGRSGATAKNRLPAVWLSLKDWCRKTREDFELGPEIDAILKKKTRRKEDGSVMGWSPGSGNLPEL